jgi:hypothetical protein
MTSGPGDPMSDDETSERPAFTARSVPLSTTAAPTTVALDAPRIAAQLRDMDEARGYRRAVQRLRAGGPDWYGSLDQAADYLEAEATR